MFTWKSLQAELSVSPFLEAEDDLNTQRGLIATAAAIVDRMSNSENMRAVTWKPYRLIQKEAATLVLDEPPVSEPKPGSGNALVENPVPLPPLPGPAPAYAPTPARVLEPVPELIF